MAIGKDLEQATPLPGPMEDTDLFLVRRVRTGLDHRATPAQLPSSFPAATITESAFVVLAADNALGTYSNKDLYITDRALGGRVVVRVLGNGAIAYDDAYEFDPANSDAPALPVSVSIVGSAVVTSARTGGPWQYIGDPANKNRSVGPLDPSNTFTGLAHYSNTYGTEHFDNAHADQEEYCRYGDRHSSCTYGIQHYGNTYEQDHESNTYGFGHAYNVYGSNLKHCSFGDNIQNLVVGNSCQYVQVGNNCARVEIHNCSGTALAPFVIPDGTTDARFENNARVLPGTSTGSAHRYNVQDYGAAGNFVQDDTAAIQAAINAAFAGGGGEVYFPDGHYKIAGPLINNLPGVASDKQPNSQLYIPLDTTYDNLRRITLQGESWSSNVSMILTEARPPRGGVVLESTLRPAAGTMPQVPAIIGSPAFNDLFSVINFTVMSIDKITLRCCNLNGSTVVPLTMSAINGLNMASLNIGKLRCDVTTSVVRTLEPTAPCFGVITPALANRADLQIDKLLVLGGYSTGLVMEEHCVVQDLTVIGCKLGLQTGGRGHTLTVNKYQAEGVQTAIRVSGASVTINHFGHEQTQLSLDGVPLWYNYINDCDNAENGTVFIGRNSTHNPYTQTVGVFKATNPYRVSILHNDRKNLADGFGLIDDTTGVWKPFLDGYNARLPLTRNTVLSIHPDYFPLPGASLRLYVKQNATGGYTFGVPGTHTPLTDLTADPAPNAITEYAGFYDGQDLFWRKLGSATGSPTPVGPPTLSSASPGTGSPGTAITLTGTNLGSATSLTFNGTAAAITSNTATSIATSVPTGATTGNIVVTTAQGTASLAFTVTTGAPVDKPVLNAASVQSSNASRILLNYSRNLDAGSVPAAGDFALNGGRTVSTVAISGGVVTLTASSAFTSSDTITLSYTPGSAPLQDLAGNDADAFTSRAVTNNLGTSTALSDADANAYVLQEESTGAVFTPTQREEFNQFFIGLKADTVYSKVKAGYLFVGGDLLRELNFVNPQPTPGAYQLTGFGSQSMRTSQGLDIRQLPGTSGLTTADLPANDYAWCMWTTGADASAFAQISTSAGEELYPLFTDGRSLGYDMGTTHVTVAAPGQLLPGLTVLTSASDALRIYHNGTLQATSSAPQVGWRGAPLQIAPNTTGTYAFGAILFTAGLTAADNTALYARLGTLMTALGRGI